MTENNNRSQHKKPQSVQNPNKAVLSYLHDVVFLLAGALLVFLLLFRIVVVSGSSMQDTLVNGDYVLLLNNIFCGDPKQGDIVVVGKKSFKDGEPIIKRVIATEGQTVTIKNGQVMVDGVVLEEDYLDPDVVTLTAEPMSVTVEEGHIFCLGDNRGVSKDSRSSEIGQIDCREVLGKAILNFLPRSVTGNGFDFGRFGGIS